MINKKDKIFIAGINGMVGSSCKKLLIESGYSNVIGLGSKELDLKNYKKLLSFLSKENPRIIINAAAKVGGILANNEYPYDFLSENLVIQTNLINISNELNIQKFIFLGSSCIYPKFCKQPIKEEYLLTDSLEATNQWYAIAKIAGVKLIESINIQFKRNYISLMPTNLYGTNDNFNLKKSHVLPALIRKFHEAKINNIEYVNLWGSGKPLREFLHVDDLANAIKFIIENDFKHHHLYNVGSGYEISIKDLANLIKNIVGFDGKIIWDKSKPDGTPRKLLDSTRINRVGWQPKIDLETGINDTYNWFCEKYADENSNLKL